MNYKSICVAGVDGTGKSSTIESLKKTIGEDRVTVQYMGARLWETKLAQKYIGTAGKENLFRSIMIIIAFPVEMFQRVNKYRGTKKLVIFDRYVEEQVVIRRAKGGGLKNKIVTSIYSVLFHHIIHKPSMTFYLTCPIEVSLARKNDIQTDEEKKSLVINKNALDNYYRSNLQTKVIDTSICGPEEVVKSIAEDLKIQGLI